MLAVMKNWLVQLITMLSHYPFNSRKQVSISQLTTALAFAPQWMNVVYLMHLTALSNSNFNEKYTYIAGNTG